MYWGLGVERLAVGSWNWRGPGTCTKGEWEVYIWNWKENMEVTLGEINCFSMPSIKLGGCHVRDS